VKTMAEVLTEHSVFEFDDESRLYRCRCRVWMADEDAADHQADALTAAGFGPGKAAAAGALRDAAANILTNDPLDYWAGHLPEGLGFQEAMSLWLKAHAAAIEAGQ
jgi:hypothetical protein